MRANVAGRRVRRGAREVSALGVLLLVIKNASWSAVTGHYVNPPPLPSILWWYALCALHLSLTATPLPGPIRIWARLAAVTAWLGCASAFVFAWLFFSKGRDLIGKPAAEWHDFVLLALAFACAAFGCAASRRT